MQQTILNQLAPSLRHERYQLIGAHSAVKKCRWLHQSLVQGRVCYKQKFYGVESHRCLQMTPAAYYCTLRCQFCWRVQLEDVGLEDEVDEVKMPHVDSPELIVNGCVEAQRRILSGYKAHSEVSRQKYEEALNPRHAAISLTGEPTLYPSLGELINRFHSRGMTTFLVTNGTVPEALGRLPQEPTQLYISLHAPDENTFRNMCRPHTSKAWESVNESLELLKSFRCPTALRLTLVRAGNMENVQGYAKLVQKAESTYVEAKSFMYVGFSRRRLRYENMLHHEEVKVFAEELSERTGYKIIDESVESRVVLLSRLEKPVKLGSGSHNMSRKG